MTNTTTESGKRYKPGDIVLARIKFKEIGSNLAKTRPALVISSESHNENRKDLILLKISSKRVRDKRWEMQIPFLSITGLLKPSKVVCDNVTSVYADEVALIGEIDGKSLAKIRKKLSLLLGL